MHKWEERLSRDVVLINKQTGIYINASYTPISLNASFYKLARESLKTRKCLQKELVNISSGIAEHVFFTKLSADITHVPFVVQTSMYFFHIFDWKLFISFYFSRAALHCMYEWNVKCEMRGKKRKKKKKIRTWVMRRTLMCLQKHMWRPNNTEKNE